MQTCGSGGHGEAQGDVGGESPASPGDEALQVQGAPPSSTGQGRGAPPARLFQGQQPEAARRASPPSAYTSLPHAHPLTSHAPQGHRGQSKQGAAPPSSWSRSPLPRSQPSLVQWGHRESPEAKVRGSHPEESLEATVGNSPICPAPSWEGDSCLSLPGNYAHLGRVRGGPG